MAKHERQADVVPSGADGRGPVAGKAGEILLAFAREELLEPLAAAIRALAAIGGDPGLPAPVREGLDDLRGGLEGKVRRLEAILDLDRIERAGGGGRGNIVRVEVPGTGGSAAVSPAHRAAAPGPPAPAPRARRPIDVLIVEDHADTARVLVQLLRGRGFRVWAAASLVEAREIAGRQAFDILVADIGLPDGSGLDLLPELAASSPGIQGIALSGYGMEEDIEESRAAGFAEHLTKPVEFSSLFAALDRLSGAIEAGR